MSDCARWIERFEALETGEPVSVGERAFLDNHAATCPRCGAERRALASLQLPAQVAPSARDDALAAAVLARSAPPPTRRWPALVAVGALAASLAVFLARPAPPPPSTALFVVSRVAGEVTLNGAPAVTGAALTTATTLRVESGDACLEVSTGGSFCFSSGSEATGFSLEGPERMVHLARGTVRVTMQKQPPGVRTGVHTDEGVALAVGTQFEVTREATTRVRVSEGRVLTRRDRVEVMVEAGGEHELAPAVAEVPAPPVEPPPEPPPAIEPPRPPTPPADRPKPRATAPAPAPVPAGPSAEDLLRDARALKREGRPAEAARRYEQLLSAHPGTPEALAGLLALSELELSALRHPDRALSLVRRYLELKGPLREEALVLQIRALQALGRAVEVTAKVEAFRREFPDSPLLDGLPR
jgi:ferric-dicitrate binding protein FerR (iron transport regulator)